MCVIMRMWLHAALFSSNVMVMLLLHTVSLHDCMHWEICFRKREATQRRSKWRRWRYRVFWCHGGFPCVYHSDNHREHSAQVSTQSVTLCVTLLRVPLYCICCLWLKSAKNIHCGQWSYLVVIHSDSELVFIALD